MLLCVVPALPKRLRRLEATLRSISRFLGRVTIMDQHQLENFKTWFDNYTAGFYGEDDFVNSNLKLKYEHTRRVCREMQFLTDELGLTKNQKVIAEAIALFHDIGRFKQFIKYGMYDDAKTVNHSLLGLEVLKEEKVLEDVDKDERELIEKAIEYHGIKQLPDNLNGDCLLLSKLIRDADKLDIFYVATEYFMKSYKGQKKFLQALGVPTEPGYSPLLVEAVMQGKQVNYNQLRHMNDMTLLQIAWVYDVNFPATIERIKHRKFLDTLFGLLPKTEDMRLLKEKIDGYVDSRCASDTKERNYHANGFTDTYNQSKCKSGQGS
ncbi:MAG: hypothetical protein A2173_04355 [Planctomycetes bacterium RBG_13_44_8b]|nr:MAG: hypothetical protein A2173_04355 [Planctomycetes bacterium RBG_13_44_8b]